MRRHHGATEWLMLVTLALMWGSAFTLTKVAVTGLPALLVATSRLCIAAVILAPIAFLGARRPTLTPRLAAFLLLIALFGYALPFSLVSWGQSFIDSGVAGILMAVMPLATLGLAHALIPGERITVFRAAGFLAGFLGVAVLMGPSAWQALMDAHNQLLPMMAVLGGACSYAVSSILARLRPDGDAVFTAATTIMLAAMFMIPVAHSQTNPSIILDIGAREAISLCLLGIICTALAAIIYFKLVKTAGPTFVSQLSYLIPLWAVGSGILFLGEQPRATQLHALALILGGILITRLERREQTQFPRAQSKRLR